MPYKVNGNGFVGEIGCVNNSPVSYDKFKRFMELSFESVRTYHIKTLRKPLYLLLNSFNDNPV